jgi:hypothetical protein
MGGAETAETRRLSCGAAVSAKWELPVDKWLLLMPLFVMTAPESEVKSEEGTEDDVVDKLGPVGGCVREELSWLKLSVILMALLDEVEEEENIDGAISVKFPPLSGERGGG